MPDARPEKARIVRGRAHYLADVPAPDAFDVAFVRSVLPHAQVRAVRVPDGKGISGAELCGGLHPVVIDGPGLSACPWLPMVTDRARYAGDIVAAVWAKGRHAAEDLLERVEVDYDALPAGAPIHPDIPGDVLYEARGGRADFDAIFASGTTVFERTFRTARQSPLPLEARGVIATFDEGSGRLDLWTSTQVPHQVRKFVSRCLGLAEDRVRVRVPQVGGGFGGKVQVSPEEVALAAIAFTLHIPVRWVEDRFENLLASAHAHDEEIRMRVAVDEQGVVVAVDAEVNVDVGAWAPLPFSVSTEPATTSASLFGPYRMRAFRSTARGTASNRCPIGAYRGVGINAGVFATERMMDIIAGEMGIDALELRRRNAATALPLTTAAGRDLDSGDYLALLQRLESMTDYPALLAWRDEQRQRGRLVGIGIAFFNEHAGTGTSDYRKRGNTTLDAYDAATVRVGEDGRVELSTSATDMGTSHAESYRILAARELGLSPDRVDVVEGDTDLCPEGVGTFASRTAVGGFEAVVRALRAAGEKGLRPGTEETVVVDPHQVFPSGAHLAVAEVDPATLTARVLRYVAVEDCGTVINEPVVDGQVRGGVAMGIGDALLSQHFYDDDGQLLTASLLDYLVPLSVDVPDIETDHLESPSPATLLGSKGVGEAGTVGAWGAVPNAVADALRPLGVEVRALPCSPRNLYDAVVAADALRRLDRLVDPSLERDEARQSG